MRIMFLVMLLSWSLGTPFVRESPRVDEVEGLSLEEVRDVEARLACLKEGMSLGEVRLWLGGLLDKAPLARGGGPIAGYTTVYSLRRGYGLEIVSDRGKFVRARMRGEEWEREQEAKERGRPNSSLRPTPCQVASPDRLNAGAGDAGRSAQATRWIKIRGVKGYSPAHGVVNDRA